jgi:hypothetical protein
MAIIERLSVLPTGFIQNQKSQIWFSGKAKGFEFFDLFFWFISGFLTQWLVSWFNSGFLKNLKDQISK